MLKVEIEEEELENIIDIHEAHQEYEDRGSVHNEIEGLNRDISLEDDEMILLGF